MSDIQVTFSLPAPIHVVMGGASVQIAYSVQQGLQGVPGPQGPPGLFPSMANHAGHFLSTDGTNASWQPMDGGTF